MKCCEQPRVRKNVCLYAIMVMFSPIYSLDTTRNQWLIYLKKIIQSNIHQKVSKILRISNLCMFFIQWFQGFQQSCDISPNKSCKIYLGSRLSTWWQKLTAADFSLYWCKIKLSIPVLFWTNNVAHSLSVAYGSYIFERQIGWAF